MPTLSHIFLPSLPGDRVPLAALGDSHGVSPRAASMYGRFFGLQEVALTPAPLTEMLSDVLAPARDRVRAHGAGPGTLVYCKTQTHNTFADRNWLRGLADAQGMHDWEVASLSMTSCASALVQMHLAASSRSGGPLIVMTGEKAFHPWVNRLPVGLLAERPACAVFNAGPGGWRVSGTASTHLARFHVNADAMPAAERQALQAIYAERLGQFVEDCLERWRDRISGRMVFLPHNLNRPVTDALIRRLGWQDNSFHGDLARTGHAYCSDGFLNLAAFEAAGHTADQVLLMAAGTGVTFATCLLDRLPATDPEATEPTRTFP
ncbi:hypothetical protein KM176_20325 [Pseudooceanicola sp. CBS1P-1]|uniref:Beta-ketoacyl-[acyl-carrier-protein] synthase III C-terminal domain-containing protein n=1 Tax=Pseudooceanicola albus TaxID=2692189 RepID=A0A6L7G9R9_9RHOB|nr:MULTISPECIES: 3-oxoacyl-[acyl-carrier-protein] synthase III C-terminal domain-containing protein [Pseudooceanicola]MBT9386228.1 hypothetical protein [Pseudooceanicola endophyticus]MXN20278.1 hypothetical protein [Pseudooceanicola albus]